MCLRAPYYHYETYRRAVIEEAGGDLAKIGMEVDVLKIAGISDKNGYLESLGQRRIAEVERYATGFDWPSGTLAGVLESLKNSGVDLAAILQNKSDTAAPAAEPVPAVSGDGVEG